MSFQIAINRAAEEFKKFKDKAVGIISHNDTDGITSAAIAAKTLQRLGMSFQIHFITRKEEDILELVKSKKYKVFFLLDYGSQEVHNIAREISDVKFFVLDHHPPKTKLQFNNVIHLNPHFFEIDGGSDICGAGICYLFAKALSEKNKDLSALAIVGAIGDSQRKAGKFSGPNQEIFEQALKDGFISLEKGLRLYGWSSRPLHKALEYSTEPFIPGISGSESAAVQFLQELGINLKKGESGWRTLNDLTDDEKKKLATALIAQRHGIQEHPERIFEEKIILPKFKISELREAEVLSATLNSCAKSGHFGFAMGVALENKSDYEESKKIIQEYKKQIIDALNYFYDNRKNPKVIRETKNAIYFLEKDRINADLISTVSTILSYNLEEAGKALFFFAATNGKTKVSVRYVASKNPKNISLGEFCSKVASKLGGEGGGHTVAAGAIILAGKEEMFINAFEERVSDNG